MPNDLNRSFHSYNHLWDHSTDVFRNNHLVNNERSRQTLIDMCEYELGQRNCCYIDIQQGSRIFDYIFRACSIDARERLSLIQNHGYFRHDGMTFSDRHSIIVSVFRKITIRISPTFRGDCDLHLKIERMNATQFQHHLPLNSNGQVYHFQR